MSRFLPALWILLAGCRFGFALAPDAGADAVHPDAVPADAAPIDMAPAEDAFPEQDLIRDIGGPDAPVQGHAGSLQNAGSGPVFRLLFGMADNQFPPMPAASIKELEFNANTNSVVDKGFVATNPGPLKALDVDLQGRLLLAHYRPEPFTLDIVEISPALALSGSLALSHAADPSLAVENTHALCFLPGGNFLVAAGSNADNNQFNEYDPAGNLVRGVHTSKLATNGKGRVISCCISRSDLEVYVHEAEIDAYDGRLLRFIRPSTAAGWTVTDTVDVADIAAKLSATVTRSWSFALDQKNEQVYLAPFSPSSTTINRLIRCPAKSFSVASCDTVGELLPGATAGGSVVKSLVQIPGTDDLLAINHGNASVPEARTLYRFSAASGSWTALFDLETISGGYAEPQGYPVLR